MAYTVINRGGVYPIFLNKRPVVRSAQDVERTRRDFEYFRRPGTKAALTALLFVYAKLNPGVRYVQGETTSVWGRGQVTSEITPMTGGIHIDQLFEIRVCQGFDA